MGGGEVMGRAQGPRGAAATQGLQAIPPPSTAELSVPPHLHLLLIQDLHEAVILLLVVAHGGGEGAAAQHHGALSLTEVFLLGGIKLDGVREGGQRTAQDPQLSNGPGGVRAPPSAQLTSRSGAELGLGTQGSFPGAPSIAGTRLRCPGLCGFLNTAPSCKRKGKGAGGGALGLIATL